MKRVIIGTRGSVLALWQANFIKDKLENFGIKSELKIIKTTGDKILDAPLAKIGGKGLFTKELEDKLLCGEISLAVHSLKDVPVVLPKGLKLAAITKREDSRDCFLSQKFQSLDSLPKGAKVGTTSLRRAMQIKAIRPDLETLSLRGNVQTRLKKLQNGEFSAIILAKAGVNRLQITQSEVAFIAPFSTNALIPAMGQGALGVECAENAEIAPILAKLNDKTAQIECEVEREFVRLCDGGCQVPIGVHAKLSGTVLEISAILGLPNGMRILREKIRANLTNESHESMLDSAKNLAQNLYKSLEKKGAREILREAMAMIEDYFG